MAIPSKKFFGLCTGLEMNSIHDVVMKVMEFGKLNSIDEVNWDLPFSSSLPKNFAHPCIADYYLGTPSWGHKEWVGVIFPQKTKSEDFLHHYSELFHCIELNTSHYRIPSSEQCKKWLSQVTSHFLFCPKIYQEISHSKLLPDSKLLSLWFNFLSNIQSNLGPCFLQLPPNFDYGYKAWLFNFLKNWPKEFELALELRHPSWFQQHQILPALRDYLQSQNIGLVITDVAGRRDVLHTSVSASFTMIRFIGNNLHPSDQIRSKQWILRLHEWEKLGLKRIFFFVHQPENIHVPAMTNIIIQQINNIRNGLSLTPLPIVKNEVMQSLF